ncbi:uncharacterized protein LOC122658964 [Telopea speciosissima]|uniref:uncharacterized protein LOC122658964 n=1 Tax=Telopea speciosissima TaxID=54955 RepID=UPI001CC38FF4|nr:uncharacterized protein LOC122658964 [Telopea speciosissima]
METPASARRFTRSQVMAAVNNIPTSRKSEESEKKVLSRQRNLKNDRSALIDISNDSPIVGLAGGSLESPYSFGKKKDQPKKTPGSGEALLRSQVKTLLQKVEEEAEVSKFSLEHRPFLHLPSVAHSPSGLLAPILADIPQFTVTVQGVMDIDKTKQEVQETERSAMIRSLLLDFSEKSEISDSSECSSALSYQEEISKSPEKALEDDDASVWSIQVNASSKDEDEEEVEEVEEAEGDYYYYEEEEQVEGGGELVDGLCEGLSKMTVQEKRMPEFKGKHTRFVYNSDEEIEGEEEISESVLGSASSSISHNVLRLKGLPTPEGKHLRFPQEEED